MARMKKHSVCWTICYAFETPYDEDGFITATSFAYGRSKDEAKEKFLADFYRHPEDFYGADENTRVEVLNVIEGFAC